MRDSFNLVEEEKKYTPEMTPANRYQEINFKNSLDQ